MRGGGCAGFAALLAVPTGSEAAGRAATASSISAVAGSDGLEVHRGRVLMRVTALTDEIIRVRIARDGLLPEDASWAVLPAMRAHRATVTPLDNGFATSAIRVTVDPSSLALTIVDLTGKVITA